MGLGLRRSGFMLGDVACPVLCVDRRAREHASSLRFQPGSSDAGVGGLGFRV